MKEIIELLTRRKNELDKMESVVLKRLEEAPEGQLRISNRNGMIQYYCRNSTSDRCGKYIKKADSQLPAQLAQKEYDNEVIKAIKEEKKQIEDFLDNWFSKKAEGIYSCLNNKRKQLIVPVEETTESFVENWLNKPYVHKGFDANAPHYFTNRGLRVRSKSEIIIANTLDEMHIPFRYEYPVFLHEYGTVNADFTVLNPRTRQEFVWEHFGLMDDSKYSETATKKIMSYEMSGFYPGENLILTWETSDVPLNGLIVKQKINKYLV
jgi:hypothetical protein